MNYLGLTERAFLVWKYPTPKWRRLISRTEGGLVKGRAVSLGSDESPGRTLQSGGCFPAACAPEKT